MDDQLQTLLARLKAQNSRFERRTPAELFALAAAEQAKADATYALAERRVHLAAAHAAERLAERA